MARIQLRLACYTGLILFFELAWIRYTSAYVRVFGFYQNFVLIATFLGMGIGLLRADKAHLLHESGQHRQGAALLDRDGVDEDPHAA